MLKKLKDLISTPRSKKILIAGAVVIIVIAAAAYFTLKKVNKHAPKKTYEVAVMVRSQNSSNPEEDARVSLKAGDVLMAKEEGKSWSSTELVSYMILKMSLTEEEAQKLISPKERELSKEEIEKEMNNFREGRGDIPDEEVKSFEDELRQRKETVVMRQYQIDMEKNFPNFKANDLLSGQPYQDKVYDWSIVKKK